MSHPFICSLSLSLSRSIPAKPVDTTASRFLHRRRNMSISVGRNSIFCFHSSISCFSVTSISPQSTKFTSFGQSLKSRFRCAPEGTVLEAEVVNASEPLLLNAIRGKEVERPPVWLEELERDCMKGYRDICKRYPSYRERAENVDLAVKISLLPWKAFKPDGVMLYSDLLTPLPGMNIPYDFTKGEYVIFFPPGTMNDVDKVTELIPEVSVPFVGKALTILRKEVNDEAAVLGFVASPFTLATYVVGGGTPRQLIDIKELAFSQPKVLHALLQKFATSMTKYIQYQADSGAHAVQIYETMATDLSPVDFEEFGLPYIKQVVDAVKQTHPHLPLILYAFCSGVYLERLAFPGVDVVSVDFTVDMTEARRRLGPDVAVQGNVDPGVLLGPDEFITDRINDTVRTAGKGKHILNIGRGILPDTSEEKVAHFFEVAKGIRY